MKISLMIISLFLTEVIFHYIDMSFVTEIGLSTVVYIVIFYILKQWLDV